jgi:hypothetical protein
MAKQSLEDFASQYAPAAPQGQQQGQSLEDFASQYAPEASPQQAATAGAAAGGPVKQYEGWMRLPALAGKGVFEGLATGLGIPGDLESLADTYAPNAMRPIGSPKGTPPVRFLPTSGELVNKLKESGFTNTPELEAQGFGENLLQSGFSGAASAIPMMAIPGAQAGQLLAGGAAGNMAGEAVKKVAPDHPWLQLGAAVLGGLAGGNLLSSVENLFHNNQLAKGLTATTQALEEAKLAAQNAKISASEGLPAARLASKAVAEQSTAKALVASQQTVDAANGSLQNVAQKLGPATTLQEGGDALQSAARNWVTTTLPKKLGDLWKPVDAAIPADTPVSVHVFKNALDEINDSAGALEKVAQQLKPSAPSRLLKALNDTLESPAGTAAKPAQQAATGLLDAAGNPIMKETAAAVAPRAVTWGDVQKLRSTLGDAMSNPVIVKDVGAKNLSRLYAALSGDMRTAAAGIGDDTLKLFEDANAGSRQLYSIAEGPMSKVIASGKETAADSAPEVIASRLLNSGKKGASDLQILRQEIPEGVDQLAAAHLRTGGLDAWGKLAPEAKTALVPDTAAISTLDASHTAAQEAPKLAAAARKAALDAHGQRMAGVTAEWTSKKNATAAALQEAKKANQASLMAVKQTGPGGRQALTHIGQSLLGETIAPHLYNSAAAGLGLHVAGAEPTVALLGASVPLMYRGAKAVVKNPNLLQAPAAGGLTAANELTTPKGKAKEK